MQERQQSLTQIESGALPRVILVHGPETVWHDRVLSILRDRNSQDPLAEWNWSVFNGNKDFDLEPLFVELGMVPWGDTTKIVILKEAHLIPAAIMEKLAVWLKQTPNSNCLAVFLEKIDNRWKYVKTLRQFALEVKCDPLQGANLVRYVRDHCIKQEKKMKHDTAELFLERVGSDLLLIHNELEKLFAWSEGREEITKADVQAISSLSPGQIEKHTVFQMTDFIVQKKRQEALDVLDLLLAAGELPFRILPLIERQLRLVLAAKTSTGRLEKTANQMGENSAYALKKLAPYARNFTLNEIFIGFEAVIKADREMKLGTPGEQVLADLIIKLT